MTRIKTSLRRRKPLKSFLSFEKIVQLTSELFYSLVSDENPSILFDSIDSKKCSVINWEQ